MLIYYLFREICHAYVLFPYILTEEGDTGVIVYYEVLSEHGLIWPLLKQKNHWNNLSSPTLFNFGFACSSSHV